MASLLCGAAPAARAQPTPAVPAVIDGPSPDIAAPAGLGISVARDGTGGLVYLKQVAGVAHVFVSVLAGGTFRQPVEVDPALAGPSSQPVLAAGNGGLLEIAFINGGQLYVVQQAASTAALGAPTSLFAGASNPAIQMTNFGKAYLAFTAIDGAGFDVRTAYYYAGQWSLEAAPLNAIPADNAGTGAGRPAVAAAGDGVAIVAWGENGHVYTRRVWATAPSVVFEQADAPLPGCSETSAGQPAVAVGGDSSYAPVAFAELLTCGGQSQSRVLVNRLHASVYDGVTPADGLPTPPSDGATQPRVAVTEYGTGWVTSARAGARDVYAMALGSNGSAGPVAQINGFPNASAPDPVPAVAGLFSDLIAWQHDPGASQMPEIRIRYAPQESGLGPEQVLSSTAQGPTDAAAGLAGGGDVAGDAVVAWVQGTPGALAIVVAQLYQPPGTPVPATVFRYAQTTTPTLSWSAAGAVWGPIRYLVTLDGAQIAQTLATSTRAASALTQGAHSWSVVAANPAGLQRSSRTATVFVDTIAPVVRFKVTGHRRAGSVVHISVSYTDAPRPLPAADASGVAQVLVKWGDGSRYVIQHGKFHAYKRPGRFKVTVIVKDRAGNTTVVVGYVRIRPAKAARRRSH
jgi:hypothetical protein